MTDFLADLAATLIRNGSVPPDAIRGCTDAEINALMAAQNVTTLPTTFRKFLSYTGRNPYWFSRNDEADYEWLLDAKQYARETVEEYGHDFTEFEGAFIFQTHHDYMFHYFRTEDLTLPDPHFWVFRGDSPPERSEVAFSQHLRLWAEYRVRPDYPG
ncbi:hypothetical protein ACFXHA_13600 [Nocardia sp. NPDC059240]|uniref:hypothetical protein n=1 Tax=Nocardia sp. NPDC059240 TaxID=3346786 RepID=UPI003699D22E